MSSNGSASCHVAHFPFLAHLEVLPEWDAAARRFLEMEGTVMVLGGPDTGKSTFSRYLVYRAFAAGEPAALVDLDLGQSHLGPPAALGLGLFPPRRPGDDGLFPEALSFIGQTSPVGAILEVAVGCRVLADEAEARGYHRIVVNTSGFVQGPGALRLKRAEMELLRPRFLFALERERELEALITSLGGAGLPMPPDVPSATPPLPAEGGWGEADQAMQNSLPTLSPALPHPGGGSNIGSGPTLVRLPVSSRAVSRSPEERRAYREERFRRYFHRARRLELPRRSLMGEGVPWGQGETEVDGVQDLTDLHLRLVGLLDVARRTLALGLILPAAADPEQLPLWTPLAPEATSQVRFLKVGAMRLSLKGQELSPG